ncbi:MAG: hypothetical protein EBR30_21960 [Cytophagia bacterium]|nr:hypothetical protein [Cytophagia bacterium]
MDQILTEQTTPEEVPTPPIEPVLPEPPVITPEVPEVIVEQPTAVVNKPVYNPPPGTRVVETEGILPMRMQLSEDYTGDVEGTPEEEQKAVWNVRSLKLRRLLGI